MSAEFPEHARKYLRARGLLKKARALGVRYFSAAKTRKLVGLPADRKPSDGVGIKLRRKGKDHWNIRFLRPGAKPKFKASFGSRNEFFHGHGIDWQSIKKDRQEAIYIVEGWNKAHTLALLGIEAIGINGIYGFRATIKGAKRILSDFKHDGWRWRGRVIRICFDSDVLWKPKIQTAIARLYRLFEALEAAPEIVVIESRRDQKIGPDDLVMKTGAATLRGIPGLKLGQGVTREWAAPPYVRRLNQELAHTILESQSLILRTTPDPARPTLQIATLIKSHDAREVYATQRTRPCGQTKTFPIFELWLENKGRREVKALELNAAKSFGYDPLTQIFNTWQGWTVDPIEPDEKHSWELFKAHLYNVIASKDEEVFEYLLKSFAWWIQNPSKPSGVAIVLIGEEGSGKSFVFGQIGRLFGNHYTEIADPDLLLGRFTGHLRDSVLVFLDEAIFAGDRKQRDKLYNYITADTVMVESKGKDAFKMTSHRKYAMATNHEWAVPAGLRARRFFVVKVSSDHCNDFAYFGAIDKQLKTGGYEAMLHELLHTDLSDFEIRRLPKTKALWEQKRQSFDAVTEWYFECLKRGSLSSSGEWLNRGLVACISADAVFSEISKLATSRYDERASRTQMGQRLAKVCPQLQHRQMRTIGDHHRRSWCYVFPSLGECRDAFERYVEHPIEWQKPKGKGK